jgi:hypothetical protein
MGMKYTDHVNRVLAYERILNCDNTEEFTRDTLEWLNGFSYEQLVHYRDRLERIHSDLLGTDWSEDGPGDDGGLTGHLSFAGDEL